MSHELVQDRHMGIEGSAAAGFEGVADAFEQTVTDDGGAGAAVSVYVDGVCVVDLWAGDLGSLPQRRWGRETKACVFSATKGVAALCVHMLLERGLLDLDVPVATYWPEFAGGGKADVKVRWLLTHQVGLPMVDPSFTLDEALAVEPVVRALEAQSPLWQPGTMHGYHAMTYGYLIGEVVRRVTGRTLGTFFHDQ